jgi:hypothetical protein
MKDKYVVLLLNDEEIAEALLEFDTIEEARQAYDNPESLQEFVLHLDDSILIHMEGPDVMQARALHPKMSDDWRREIAMQEGMMGGCNAYNEAMGWPIGEDEP